MASNGLLNFQGTNKATFVGATSNIALDVVNSSLGIGITGTDPPSSNLYITGNAYVTSDISVGGVLNMGVVNVAARHTLEAITSLGASTPSTLTLTNTGTSLVASGDVTVATNTFHVDTTNNRVGVGTSSPIASLDIDGGPENDTVPALSIRGGLYDTSDLYVLNTYNVNTGAGYAAKVIGVNIKNKVETDNTVQLRNNVGGLTSAGAIYLGSDNTTAQGVFGVLTCQGSAGTTLTEKFTITDSGNVGIGTTNPLYPLDILAHSSTTPPAGVWGYYVSTTELANVPAPYDGWNQNISLRASENIIAQKFQTYSDRRIKKNIIEIRDDEALIKLRKLKPCKYNYIDTVAGGNGDVYGFIAQEVGSILPDAIGTHTGYIPNIYVLASVSESNKITFNNNYKTSNLEANSVIQVVTTDNKREQILVSEVIDEDSIRVEEDLSPWISDTGKLFVYGQEVDDFTHLDKNTIWTVATAALQEVDRQLQAEKEKVRVIDDQLQAEKEKTRALEDKVEALEDHLTRFTVQVTARLAALESQK